MESFQSGEEIERALLDLGPLLGVSIKEEAQDEALADPSARPIPPSNVGSVLDNGAGTSSGAGSVEGGEGKEPGGADSLASPSAARAPPSAARCIICNTPLAHAEGTPKLMECLHSICEPCLKAKIEEKQASSRDFLGAERITIQCPACRLQCQPANMIDQRFVLEKMSIDQSGGGNGSLNGDQQCNSCEDPEPATSYCVDCTEFICDNCVLAHQRLKITKDHTIKGKEEAIAELQAAQGTHAPNEMYCREHPQEKLSLFCETCDRLTCRDCQLHHHRDHKYQFSTEMAAQARSSLAALLSEVSYKRVLLGSAMKVIHDRQLLIADKKKALVHDITQTVVKLTNAINTRGKQLVLRLNEVCDGKQRTLAEKKEALEQLAAITDHCVDFVSAALEHAGDTALLYCKPVVAAHLQRIKSRRADIPNPEIPVRITLALDKLPDLVRVLSSIGAIVVDGKVDGGAGAGGGGAGAGGGGGGAGGSAQGPYHPPAHSSPHSAVVALQQAAMHQSFVQSGGGVGSGTPPALPFLQMGAVGGVGAVQGGVRSRTLTTPLRHAIVSSTTHPHHLHGMSEMNLRGLLSAQAQAQAQAGRPRAPHPAHQAMHAYHQMMGAYASNAFAANAANAGGRRSGGPRTPSPAPPAPPAYHHMHHQQQQQQQQQAKWHIPQHGLTNGGFDMSMMSPTGGGGGGGGSDFKITLSRAPPAAPPPAPAPAPRAPAPAVVTSTNPKTPSPSLNGGASMELDKVCAESVQDLMATIAKLDSNGVQVLPEPEPATCHSSTDDNRGKLGAGAGVSGVGAGVGAVGAGGGGSGDPNEDWCAVCMDGGELMCCDKCPKVFHQYCHIPTIEKLPDETESWQCLLCVNFAELGAGGRGEDLGAGGAGGEGLPPRLQKLVERITLELYCQYELSLVFREPVPPDNTHYHSKISRPMCLDMIRMKLQPGAGARYSHPAQFLADCRLLFRNAYAYNPPESQIYKDAKRLEEFFDDQLVKWLPEYAYCESGEGDLPAKRPRHD